MCSPSAHMRSSQLSQSNRSACLRVSRPWPVVRRTEQPGWSSSRVHCKSAWGPEADWHDKLLICLAFEGAFFGADLHPVVLHTYYDDVRGGDQVVQRLR
jgi:hypothetical protein